LKLFHNDAAGLFSTRGVNGNPTIYLPANPAPSAFFEESFHAMDYLRNIPATMELNGVTIDAWEGAKQTLLKYSEKLGLSYCSLSAENRKLLRGVRRLSAPLEIEYR